MRIVVQGTHKKKNNSVEAAGLIAAVSAIKNMQKTLVLQLTGSKHQSVLDTLIGKYIEATTIKTMGDVSTADMKGIDALLRSVGVSALSLENFNSSVEALIPDYENLLDICKQTSKEELAYEESIDDEAEQGTKAEDVISVIKQAETFYDNIILLTDGKDTEFNRDIVECADTIITCVKQANPVEGYNKLVNKKREKKSAIEDDNDLKKHEYLLVTDYFTTSRFTLQNLKKKYGTNKVLVLPFDVGRRDSVHEGTYFTYIKQTLAAHKNDDNDFYEESVEKLTDVIFANVDLPETNWAHLGNVEEEKKEEPAVLGSSDHLKPKKKKKTIGFFKKKEANKVVLEKTPKMQETKPVEKESFGEFFEEDDEETILPAMPVKKEAKKAPAAKKSQVANKTKEKLGIKSILGKQKKDILMPSKASANMINVGKPGAGKGVHPKTVAEDKPVQKKVKQVEKPKKVAAVTLKDIAAEEGVSVQKVSALVQKLGIQEDYVEKGSKYYKAQKQKKIVNELHKLAPAPAADVKPAKKIAKQSAEKKAPTKKVVKQVTENKAPAKKAATHKKVTKKSVLPEIVV